MLEKPISLARTYSEKLSINERQSRINYLNDADFYCPVSGCHFQLCNNAMRKKKRLFYKFNQTLQYIAINFTKFYTQTLKSLTFGIRTYFAHDKRNDRLNYVQKLKLS